MTCWVICCLRSNIRASLAILAQTLRKIPAALLEAKLKIAPDGIYIRKACFLYEAFTRQES
jgi:hypothetical protein